MNEKVEYFEIHSPSRFWWMYLISGIALISFGVLLLAWPGHTLEAIMIVIGIFLLAEGIIDVIRAAMYASRGAHWGVLLLLGILEVCVAIVILGNRDLALAVFAILMGIWAIILGVTEIIAAVDFPVQPVKTLLAILGVASIMLGILLIALTYETVYALSVVIGIYALFVGLVHIIRAFWTRKEVYIV